MEPISIIVATDNHYVALLAALIKSIEQNIRKNQKMDIYIIEDKVSNRNKKKIEDSINSNITSIVWKSVDTTSSKTTIPLDSTSYPLTIYMRLFIPSIIPDSVKRVLYLDVDMIVMTDLTTLFEIDLKGNIVAAVQDPRITTFDNSWGGVKNYRELSFNGKEPYFNSGFLLIDTDKWKAENITQKTIENIHSNMGFANYPDQYGLNITLANRWLKVDSEWNHFSDQPHHSPNIIHYTGRKPIYQSYNNVPEFRDTFYLFLNQTVWSNFKPISEPARYIKKGINVLEKKAITIIQSISKRLLPST